MHKIRVYWQKLYIYEVQNDANILYAKGFQRFCVITKNNNKAGQRETSPKTPVFTGVSRVYAQNTDFVQKWQGCFFTPKLV